MGVTIHDELKSLCKNPNTIKVLATTSKEGEVHASYKESIHFNEEGAIQYYELIETSQTNKNMVASIWFKKQVAINILGEDGRSYLIKGLPKKAIISGKEFQKYYEIVQQGNAENDLSAVWVIEPIDIVEKSYEKRRDEERQKHPLLHHLDRLTN